MKKPQNWYKFFDYFGLPVFCYLAIEAAWELAQPGEASWRILARLVIGIGGAVIDGYLVFFHKE